MNTREKNRTNSHEKHIHRKNHYNSFYYLNFSNIALIEPHHVTINDI